MYCTSSHSYANRKKTTFEFILFVHLKVCWRYSCHMQKSHYTVCLTINRYAIRTMTNSKVDEMHAICRVKLCLIRCGFVSLNFAEIKHGVQASFKVKFFYLWWFALKLSERHYWEYFIPIDKFLSLMPLFRVMKILDETREKIWAILKANELEFCLKKLGHFNNEVLFVNISSGEGLEKLTQISSMFCYLLGNELM